MTPGPFRILDARGHYAGTLLVLGSAFGGWSVRWAGQRTEWVIAEAELERMMRGRR